MAKHNVFLQQANVTPEAAATEEAIDQAVLGNLIQAKSHKVVKYIKKELEDADAADKDGDEKLAKKHRATAKALADEHDEGKEEKVLAAYETDMGAENEKDKKLQKGIDGLYTLLTKYGEELTKINLGIADGNTSLKAAITKDIKDYIETYNVKTVDGGTK